MAGAACTPDDPEQSAATPTTAGEEAHEHGEDTHTHPATAADTAGTYVDSTNAFFGDAPDRAQEDADHEHGPETHTHEADTTGHQ
jgi:hypothetical protein